MLNLAKWSKDIQPSATLGLVSKTQEMRKKGIEIINLSVGEPDFKTPQVVIESAIKALKDGKTKYTSPNGIFDLREAIANKLKIDNNLEYDPSQICVTCGAKQSIYNAIQVILDNDDEVIIPSPYWVSYPSQVLLAHGRPIILPLEKDFSINIENFKRSITPKTRAVILCSPSNPSGFVLEKKTLEEIASICVKKEIAIISDEIYEKIIFDDQKHISIASLSDEIKSQTLLVNGFSKAYSMTGWRVGYVAGDKTAINKICEMQSQQTTSIPEFIQIGCISALNHAAEEIEKMRLTFQDRRNLIVQLASKIQGIEVVVPKGAFYLLINATKYLTNNRLGINSGYALSQHLLEKAHVAVVAGEPFGAPHHIRISFAASKENIEEGIKRIKETLT